MTKSHIRFLGIFSGPNRREAEFIFPYGERWCRLTEGLVRRRIDYLDGAMQDATQERLALSALGRAR